VLSAGAFLPLGCAEMNKKKPRTSFRVRGRKRLLLVRYTAAAPGPMTTSSTRTTSRLAGTRRRRPRAHCPRAKGSAFAQTLRVAVAFFMRPASMRGAMRFVKQLLFWHNSNRDALSRICRGAARPLSTPGAGRQVLPGRSGVRPRAGRASKSYAEGRDCTWAGDDAACVTPEVRTAETGRGGQING
jgi:hypothetical protein